MDWNTATLWWIAGGVLVAAELATGSFYLLMVALGCAAGALAAHAGQTLTVQIVVAALLGAAATVAWHVKRSRHPHGKAVESDRDVNIDIGQTVQVEQWAGDGSARVKYRGAAWSVRFTGAGSPLPGEHVIVALNGNELRVAPAAPTR